MNLLELFCNVYDIEELYQLDIFEKEKFIDILIDCINNTNKYPKSKELLKLL